MRIVQTAFGVFHSFDLARELHSRGYLAHIYSTWPWQRLRREGIPRSCVSTFPWIHTPEFLLGRYGLLPHWLEDQTGYANALAFDEYTLRVLPRCDALIALSGSALKTGRRLQQLGGKYICDRGSSHQRFQEDLLSDEYARWGISRRASDPRDTSREEAIYEQADHITVPSTFALDSFLRMGVSRHKLTRIPYGVQLERFTQVSRPAGDTFVVTFVGGVSLRKGVPYLLQAFNAVRHVRKRLQVVGAIASEMKPLLGDLPTEGVEFFGAVPQRELPEILSRSHVFVLPSIEDGFGTVLGQAMACGCPVIASTNSGGPDIVTPGVNGYVTAIRDVPTMTQYMQRLADDRVQQAAMSAAAQQGVARLGGWQDYGQRWEDLLRRLLSQSPSVTDS